MIGQARRGKNVAKRLRQELRRNELKTEPDFDVVHIDSTVAVSHHKPEPLRTKLPLGFKLPIPAVQGNAEVPSCPPPDMPDADREVVLTIGQIPAAQRPPTFINRDDTIERAVTLLLQENLTHLVVSQNERSVDGIVSWQSIGRSRASQRPAKTVADCMDVDPHVVSFSAALFDTVRHIIQAGAVLVKASDKKISVTPPCS